MITNDQTLYLSKDKEQLLNENGQVVAVRKIKDGRTFYQETGNETKGKGKVCVRFSSKKVCVEWNDNKVCVGWGDVEVCVEWQVED